MFIQTVLTPLLQLIDIPVSSAVNIEIFNSIGQSTTLVDQMEAGSYW
jgi:hypothetical protein